MGQGRAGRRGRVAAAIVALVAFAGVAIQFRATLSNVGSAGGAVWVLLRYFTIIANLIVAGVFAALALTNRPPKPSWLLGGAVISIALVGVIYTLLLRGLLELSGGQALADFLLHYVSPVLAPLWWLAFAPKGGLRYRDTLIWCALPLGYTIYAIARGAVDGMYAYPFLNIAERGVARVAATCGVIAVGYLVSACAFVALDGVLGRRKRR
ncbi:MAG: hypothetical protein BGN86_00200 [Caulobacterales bacterium 68-7]|nr:MAG: hypothetical protein BGN86_00200 [Caulobacterales bacterium 68-7]